MSQRIEGLRPATGPPAPALQPRGTGFAAALDRATAAGVPPATPGALHLSRHAQDRLNAARRSLTPTEQQQIQTAVDAAAAKGSRQALLLLPDLALVVHPPSRTVITAVTDERSRSGVFTGIDCTVVLNSSHRAGPPSGGPRPLND